MGTGRFQEGLASQQSWLHDLAKGEVHPEAEKLLQLGKSFDPQQLVEESAIEFLTELREEFGEHSRIFNSYSENAIKFQDIKIYGIAQTASDFMLFRNQVKLIFANSAHGVIQITFAQHIRGTLAVDGQEQGSTASGSAPSIGGQPQELLAQIGPFRDVYWTFQGEKVTPEQVAKFYFVEFARGTRDTKRSRGSNQLLLDQIKALLQEKGLDL